MNNNDNGPTGYKQPPRHRQFVPGQSGNPNGRPKGAKNFKTDLREELSEIISFREADGEVAISKQRALIKRLVTSAINGDARAIATVMSFCARSFGGEAMINSKRRRIARSFRRLHAARPNAAARLR